MELHSLLLPVPALGPALALLREALGLEPALRDGERYAALPAQALRIALGAGDESISDTPALVVRVADLDTALAKLLAHGAELRHPAAAGPHERRAVVDAAGIAIVISQKTAAP
ncbi:VOC family protein [Solimonas soli]|uniref:VOC family protein n=1 Tax=Solimonas soli TaxID=413479 RepID=UPI000487D18A|nr:VOC family protein [Solimonas soli]